MLIDGFVSAAKGRGGPLDVPLFWWQGYSGRYHLTSIFDLKKFECREPGAFILVRREHDGTRTPLFAGVASSISDDIYDDDCGDELMRAIHAGANEIHVNFAADCEWLREEMVRDVARGWSLKGIGARAYA